MFVPENQFLVVVTNAAGVPCQPAAEGHLPSNTPLATWLWITQAAPPGPSLPQQCRLRLWDVQGYLAEQSGSDVEHKVNAFPLRIRPLSLPCRIQRCRPRQQHLTQRRCT